MTDPSASVPAGARPRPIVLVVLDGFGIGHDPAADAVAAAPMPIWRGLLERWPHAALRASEDAVGLPAGQMGNSEVGHLNLGAGRPVLQDLPRIDAAIADGTFFERPALLAACARARETNRKSTRLNSSHLVISYAVFCLKKKKNRAAAGDIAFIDSKEDSVH